MAEMGENGMDKKRSRRNKEKDWKSLLATIMALLLTVGSWNLPWTLNVHAESSTEVFTDGSTEEILTEQQTELQQTEKETKQSESMTEQEIIIEDIGEIIESESAKDDSAKVVAGWNWINEDELEIQQDEETGIWGLGLPGVNADNQADFDTIVSMLPASIEATIQDTEQAEELAIIWSCENYVQDENGNWPVSGTYTFCGTLPDGYAFADNTQAVEITIDIGGGSTYENTGGFTVTGGTYGADYTYDTNDTIGILTVLTSTPLTITTNSVAVNAVIQLQADNAHITLKDVVINSDSNLVAFVSQNGWGSIVCPNVNPHITLEGTNVIADTTEWAGEINCNTNADTLTIDGSGSLECEKILFYFWDGYQNSTVGTLSVENATLNYDTLVGAKAWTFKSCVVNGRTYDENGNGPTAGTAGSLSVDGPGWDYNAGSKELVIKASGDYHITGNGAGTGEKIKVEGNLDVKIYLNNVKCSPVCSAYETCTDCAGMNIDGSSSVKLVLEGTNTFISGSQLNAGIEYNESSSNATLTITGSGTLIAKGSDAYHQGAGIGGGNSKSSGKIVIDGGIIEANSVYGAGIGGGPGGNGSNITINGGSVTASSTGHGAGIGGGLDGNGKNITINGGTITANGVGAGIGGGGCNYPGNNDTGFGENITITGGIVTAHSESGAGIGGSGRSHEERNQGLGKNIVITGGTVTASSNSGAGIGGGEDGSVETISIKGGIVTATSESGAGIGTGICSVPCSPQHTDKGISIDGGTVTAKSTNGDGIGLGKINTGVTVVKETITIKNGNVKASSITTQPTINGTAVYLTTITLEGASDGTVVNSITGATYSTTGMQTIDGGKLYLYLPADTTVTRVTAGGEIYNGSVKTTSNGTASATFRQRQEQSAPAKPTVNAKTDTTITLKTITTVGHGEIQYGYATTEGGSISNWQSSTSFTGLSPVTTYYFASRYAGDDSYKPSEVTAKTVVTTDKRTQPADPVFKLGVGADSAKVTVKNYNADYTDTTWFVCIKKGDSLTDDDFIKDFSTVAYYVNNLEPATEYTCYVKFGGNDSYKESNTVSQTFYTNAAEPQPSALKIDYENETVSFDSIYEVNTKIGFDGTSLTSGDSISQFISNYGESTNALYIRVKAVENGPGASIELPITISRPAMPNSVSKIGSTASSISFTSYSGWEYKMESGSWQSSNTFTGLSASKSYNFAVRTKATTWSFASTEQIISNVSTEQASYTVSIPKTTAKVPDKGTSNIGNISVTEDATHKFDLGNNGKVKVSVSSGTDADGKITLIRDQDVNTKITSLLSTNDAVCSLNKVLVTYSATNKRQTIPISLAAPEYAGTTIPAGTYKGTVSFKFEYTEK